MKELFGLHKWRFYITSFALLVLFFILPFATKVRVEFGQFYDTRVEVSLYILEYGKLPNNYITKGMAEQRFGTHIGAIEEGFNIGGDIFDYRGAITDLTNLRDLKEADLYQNRETVRELNLRGTYRLVFSSNGEQVFFTRNHYESFSRMTIGRIQLLSTVFWVVFGFYTVGMTLTYYMLLKNGVLQTSEIRSDARIIGRKILYLLSSPVILFFALLKAKRETSLSRINHQEHKIQSPSTK